MLVRKDNRDIAASGSRFLARAKKYDRLAAWLINIGGLLVILSVISILVLILKVAVPLFIPPHATVSSTVKVAGTTPFSNIMGLGVDDNLKTGFILDDTGTFIFFDSRSGAEISRRTLETPGGGSGEIAAVSPSPGGRFDILWKDGSFTAVKVSFPESEAESSGQPEMGALAKLMEEKAEPGAARPLLTMARFADEKSPLRLDLLPGNRFAVAKTIVSGDLLGNETVKKVRGTFGSEIPGNVTAAALDGKGEYLYVGTDSGRLLRYDLSNPESPSLLDSVAANADGRAVTALNLVLGDNSIAVADAEGSLSTWFPASETGLGSGKVLTKVHPLARRTSVVTAILPASRSKTIFSLDQSGAVSADHMTTERRLMELRTARPLANFAVSSGDKAAVGLDADRNLTFWRISNPHPEVSLKTLFAPVWYENYDKPAFVWQSSAASDDFEPKLSLTPLIFGTMKGTFYAMIFAVPLALLGAIYTSQFLGTRLKKYIKPAIEIMAAIPSVVIGFLAGLWLAPLLDKSIVSFMIALLIIPFCLALFILIWRRIGSVAAMNRMAMGKEFLLLVPALILGAYLSHALGGIVESSFFSGDFKLWLFNATGARYDQRNSIIIAFALGLAVTPLIFTIAEDALSNVPKNLSAASLALGASRWQTAWRVVLPSALPGVFSAIMIGFGRAVGETMIVLMATGNTPIIDWNIINGFRSLSANIAVEIPEAPVFGTLYRVLFLSAVLLFIFTFIINTVAEILRQNFRRKYGRF